MFTVMLASQPTVYRMIQVKSASDPEHRRNQLRNRGMNVHRALDHGVRRLGVHHIEDASESLHRRRCPESRRPGSACVSRIDQIFMKPCVSPFSTARATLVIGRLPTSALPARLAHVRLRHARAAQRRIDVERVGGMRSLTRRGSLSSRFAATISKSL